MRTRILPSMTNYEVEKYLEQNDIIFVPVGVAEMHGALPVDVEYVQAEAWARLFAEKVDGLVMTNLVYFNPGATAIGRGTVQMGMTDGFNYMKAIARSLLNQGFRRQVYIPAHGPTTLFLHGMIHEFFEETKVPMLLLQPHHLFMQNGLVERRGFFGPVNNNPLTEGDTLGCNTTTLGAYKICGRLGDVPNGAEANIEETLRYDGWTINQWFPEHDLLSQCAGLHAAAPFFYTKWWDHGSGPLPETRELIEREAEIGELHLRGLIDRLDFLPYMEALRKLDNFTREEVLPKHADKLQKCGFR